MNRPCQMRRIALGLALSLALVACVRAIDPLVVPKVSAVALTGGPNTSMIYVARTTEGVIAIDLGWWGSRRALDRALKSLGSTHADVQRVFLTHSHRDHIAGWPMLRHARYYMAASEKSRLFGDTAHKGWLPRTAERLKSSGLPQPGELTVESFTRDTAFVIGADTLRAYLVTGHTGGSVVYLFRGVLFLGDAVTYTRAGGFAPAQHMSSDDPGAAAKNLASLWPRLPEGKVRYACTAHARCAEFTPTFLKDVAK